MSGKIRLRRFPPFQLVTYAALRTLMAVISRLSPRSSERVSGWLARAIHAVDAKHRRIAIKNVTNATGMPKDPAEVDRFVRECYRGFTRAIVENLQLPKLIARGELLGRTRMEGIDQLKQALAGGRGAVMVIAHLGNWEFTGIAGGLVGFPMNVVVRPIENPYIDRYLSGFRTLTGVNIISKYGALGPMSEALRRGEVLVILADQDARRSGLFLPFFGQPALVVKSPALLALRHRCPIVPVNIYRDEQGIHHAVCGTPIVPGEYPSKEQGIYQLTAAFTAQLEGFIRQHPTQWLWMHDRWKTAARVLREEERRRSSGVGTSEITGSVK